MKTTTKRYARVAVLATFLLLIAGGAWAQAGAAGPVTDANVVERIAQAKTPAEHQAIALYYKAQAADAAAKVKEHEAMVKAYGGTGSKTMNRHCETLLKTYRAQQKDLEGLAKDHEDMAAAAA